MRVLEEVTTKKKAAKVGQRFMLEVAAPMEVDGVTVIPAGTPAWGEIVSVRNKGMWGKSGHLEAKPLFARVNGRQIRLTGSFDDKGKTGTAGVISAATMLFIVGAGTPASCCSIWNRRTSSVLAVWGERPSQVAKRPTSRR